MSACKGNASKFADKNIQAGYELAQTYCKRCHQLPEPEMLDKATWINNVLPQMGKLAGFRHKGLDKYADNGQPRAMELAQWINVVHYYVSQAPESLTVSRAQKIAVGLNPFKTQYLSFSVDAPLTTMVYVDSMNRHIFFGDGISKQLYEVSSGGGLTDSFNIGTGITDLHRSGTNLYVLTMGVLQPSDQKSGKLQVVDLNTKKITTLLDTLQRAVHASYADLNNDQRDDIIICEFGNTTGFLSWFENIGNGHYRKHVLRPLPGAIKTMIYDFNQDGRPDIIGMMAQADEGVFIWYNEGNGTFREQRVLQWPPVYGSNNFQLGDMDGDGHIDIITTNGDNADYSQILKNYHGVRIYLNDGKDQFKEATFLPVNGIGKAIVQDFDADGDLDIATIAYFPDFVHTPEESFIYFENGGSLDFKAFTFPDVLRGRWLTMDAGDFDGDGDTDIILGNASFGIGIVPAAITQGWQKYHPSVIVLKNKLHP